MAPTSSSPDTRTSRCNGSPRRCISFLPSLAGCSAAPSRHCRTLPDEPAIFVAPAVARVRRGGGEAILPVDGAVRARGPRRAVAAIGFAGGGSCPLLCADRPLRGHGGRSLGGRSASPSLPCHLSPR